ncbi:MAG: transposase [Candidatus Hydrogenedentota bacterium]
MSSLLMTTGASTWRCCGSRGGGSGCEQSQINGDCLWVLSPVIGAWVPHDTRDALIDFVAGWSEKTGLPQTRFVGWVGISHSKFFDWKKRYGKANEHNGKVPRDFWLTPGERQAIVDYYHAHPLEGYRRLTFMMLDEDVVAASPVTVWRVLSRAGLLGRWNRKVTGKGKTLNSR